MTTRARTLKLWNGRWGRNQHAYAAAYSLEDLLSLAVELNTQYTLTRHEVTTYWSRGLWGRPMDGIEPERGIWVKDQTDVKAKPQRLQRRT